MRYPMLFVQFVFVVTLLLPGQWSIAQQENTAVVAGAQQDIITVGKVTTRPRKVFPRFKGLADFLAQNLQELGVKEVQVVFAKSNEEMLKMIQEGRIDFISETMFSSMRYMKEAGVEILVREWRNNVPEYHTIFFARKDSNIQTLADLRGKTLAFEDEGSTSAYFLPRSVLMRQGAHLVEMGWPVPEPEPVPAGSVGYVFAKTEGNIPIWVHENRVQAGVLSNTDWLDEELVPPAIKKDLVIFHETEPVPRSLLVCRKGVATAVRERVVESLLNEYSKEENLQVIKKHSKVTKYDRVPYEEVQRFQSLYESLKEK